MIVDGVKYAVPLDEANPDYAILKRFSVAGPISLAVAD
jgi:hypothetical protein